MNLQLFAEPDEAQEEAAVPPEETDSENGSESAETITMTQPELDAKIVNAKGQARRTAEKAVFERLGKSEAEITALIAADAEANPPQQEDKNAAQLRAMGDAVTKMQAKVVDSAIIAAAAALGFHNPANAAKLVDRTGIEIDDDLDITGVQEAVEALKKSDPHLAKPNNAPPVGGAISGAQAKPTAVNPGAARAQARREADQKARKAMEAITQRQ